MKTIVPMKKTELLSLDKGATSLPEGFRLIGGALTPAAQRALLREIQGVIAAAPPVQPRMPRTGQPFSVKMSNCGALGWVSDQEGGYRYQPVHPETCQPWPPMPEPLLRLWRKMAGFDGPPEACLINFYPAGPAWAATGMRTRTSRTRRCSRFRWGMMRCSMWAA